MTALLLDKGLQIVLYVGLFKAHSVIGRLVINSNAFLRKRTAVTYSY
jgi:hypothetical protein